MADTYNEIHAQTFGRNIMQLAQQKYSKLYPAVFKKTGVEGKNFFQDQIGKWEMGLKAGRQSATPLRDPGFARRMCPMFDYNDARPLDREDDLKTISDPKSAMSLAASASIGRRYDDTIIAAALGTSYSGEAGTTSVVLPSAQKLGESSSGLTFNKVRATKLKFDEADIEPEDRVFVISPTGLFGLLGEEEATSADYAAVKALVKGEINSWMGFEWIMSTRLPVSSSIRSCFAFHRNGIVFGEATSPFVRTEERNDLSYTWQIYYAVHIGAIRLEESRVVQVDIREA